MSLFSRNLQRTALAAAAGMALLAASAGTASAWDCDNDCGYHHSYHHNYSCYGGGYNCGYNDYQRRPYYRGDYNDYHHRDYDNNRYRYYRYRNRGDDDGDD